VGRLEGATPHHTQHASEENNPSKMIHMTKNAVEDKPDDTGNTDDSTVDKQERQAST
jgi:hypothetical protein